MLNILLKSIRHASRSSLFMVARRIYLKMKIPMKFPLIVNVDPTNACNLRCTMCPNSRETVIKKGFMDMDLYRKIICEIEKQKKRIYRFFLVKDGEPLLHKNIVEMVSLAKEKKIANIVTVVTNGVLLDEEKATGFIGSGLDDIGISVDAATRETYHKIKGRDDYDILVANIERLVELKKKMKKKNPNIRLKFIETEDNKHEKEIFINKWKNKVDKLEINPLHDWGGSLEVDQTGSLCGKSLRYPCALLWYTMVINCNGTVSLCCIDYNWETVVGSVKDNTLEEIWNGKAMEEIRRKHVFDEYETLPLCKTCTYWKIKEDLKSYLKKKYK